MWNQEHETLRKDRSHSRLRSLVLLEDTSPPLATTQAMSTSSPLPRINGRRGATPSTVASGSASARTIPATPPNNARRIRTVNIALSDSVSEATNAPPSRACIKSTSTCVCHAPIINASSRPTKRVTRSVHARLRGKTFSLLGEISLRSTSTRWRCKD